MLFDSDPNNPLYYFPFIIAIFTLLGLLQLVILYFQNKDEDLNSSLNQTLTVNSDYSITFITNKNSLKYRYIIAYLLTRASVWAKSPYIWSMYLFYHKFTVPEIGVLYIIDGLSALIFGPIIGNLADLFGRKRFCQFYNLSVCINLALRLTGNQHLAYLAQVITGIGAGLANTSFESWVVSESIKEFRIYEHERERFLKKLFKTINLYDACLSIIISALSAILYTFYGVLAPIIISILFSVISMLVIQGYWNENEIQIKGKSIGACYSEALKELYKREVLSLGIAESVTLAVQNLFLFLWTPILLATAPSGQISLGFVFICLVTSIMLGTKVFEIGIIYIQAGLYSLLSLVLLLIFSSLLVVYFTDDFLVRLICFSLLNGLAGLYQPLFSFIKYRILEEKHRALLMNIFRIPLNLFVVISLLLLRYLDPLHLCLIAAGLAFTALLIILSLIIIRPIIPKDGKSAFSIARKVTLTKPIS